MPVSAEPQTDIKARSSDAAVKTVPARDARAMSDTATKHPRRRMVLTSLAVVLLGALLAIAFLASHQSQYVLSRNAAVRGQITEVGTRLNGVLAAIEVREGERVKAGRVLARLDDRHLRSEELEALAQIEGLEAELELERSRIAHERAKLGTRLQESQSRAAAADAELVAAQSQADEARDFHEARKGLVELHAISPEELRTAESKFRTATAMVDVARNNGAAVRSVARYARLDATSLDLREQRLGVLQARVHEGKARLARARDDIEGSLLRAPGDGAVLRWIVKPGGSVRIGEPVVSMAIGENTWIEAWVDEDEIHRIKPGSTAKVTLPSHAGQEFEGVVYAIGLTTDMEAPAANEPQSRYERMRDTPMVGVRVRLKNSPERLLPGLSAVVAIRGEDD